MSDFTAKLRAAAGRPENWDVPGLLIAAAKMIDESDAEIARLNAGIGLLLDRIPTSEAAFSREAG